MKDIKSLFLAAKNSQSPRDINSYHEAVNELLHKDPNSYVSQTEYIIKSSDGLATFKEFVDTYGLSVSIYDRVLECVNECIDKTQDRMLESGPYEDMKEYLEGYYAKYKNSFDMYSYYKTENVDEYVNTYYGFNKNGVQNADLVAGMIENFGEMSIPDLIIRADKKGNVDQVLEYVEELDMHPVEYTEGVIGTIAKIVLISPIILMGIGPVIGAVAAKLDSNNDKNEIKNVLADILGVKPSKVKMKNNEWLKKADTEFDKFIDKHKDTILKNFYKPDEAADICKYDFTKFNFAETKKKKNTKDASTLCITRFNVASGLVKKNKVKEVADKLNKLDPKIKVGVSVDKPEDMPGDDNGEGWEYFKRAGIIEGGPEDTPDDDNIDGYDWLMEQYDKAIKSGYVVANYHLFVGAKDFIQSNMGMKESTDVIEESEDSSFFKSSLSPLSSMSFGSSKNGLKDAVKKLTKFNNDLRINSTEYIRSHIKDMKAKAKEEKNDSPEAKKKYVIESGVWLDALMVCFEKDKKPVYSNSKAQAKKFIKRLCTDRKNGEKWSRKAALDMVITFGSEFQLKTNDVLQDIYRIVSDCIDYVFWDARNDGIIKYSIGKDIKLLKDGDDLSESVFTEDYYYYTYTLVTSVYLNLDYIFEGISDDVIEKYAESVEEDPVDALLFNEWVYRAFSPFTSSSVLDSIKESAPSSIVDNMKSSHMQEYRESMILGDSNPMIGYTEEEIDSIKALIDYKEYELSGLESSDAIIECQNEIYSLYEELDGIIYEEDDNINPEEAKKNQEYKPIFGVVKSYSDSHLKNDGTPKSKSEIKSIGTKKRVKTLMRGDNYSHALVSFNDDLTEMYSYEGKGIVEDNIEKVDSWMATDSIYICVMYVPKDDWNRMHKYCKDLVKNQSETRYDWPSMIKAFVGKPNKKDKRFICSTFVAYILRGSNPKNLNRDYSRTRPEDVTILPRAFYVMNVKDRLEFNKRKDEFKTRVKSIYEDNIDSIKEYNNDLPKLLLQDKMSKLKTIDKILDWIQKRN